jgi:hypothetical protein
MAGYKETFGGNVDFAYGQGLDMTRRLENNARGLANAGRGLAEMAGKARSATAGIKGLNKEIADLESQRQLVAAGSAEFAKLTKQINNARESSRKFAKQLTQLPFDSLEKGLGKLTGGLIAFNGTILKMSFDFLITSIKKVYDLQEKWTKAIGGFNMKLGGMTAGLKGAQQAATQWSSTIRGLTNGDINEGIQMFGEFTMAIGRTVKAGDGFSKLGIQLARGFGIGGAGAGALVKVFENIGMSADDSAKAMKTSIAAANQAGIPVNMLADDLAKSTSYMARFGKEGQKTLITGAAWARKYDITLQQLKTTVEGFDTFDEAAKSASSLNSAFGTMINSMDLMMEDDPAKRLDMIRQQMLAQGMTYDRLSPKQRRYFTETMHLSEEQTAALLDATNAGESYSDFQAKAAAREKKEADAKKLMQKQLQSTVQTMYAFGMAFDRITVAIAKAIRPLLEVFGLAKTGGKEFKSFGQVMAGITDTVEAFFLSLADPKNTKWNNFMKELGKDLLRAGHGLKAFVMDGRAGALVGDLAGGMKSFYTTVRDFVIKLSPMFRPALDLIMKLSGYIKELSYAWAGMKVFNMVGGSSALGKLGGVLGGGGYTGGAGGGKGGGGKMAGRLAMAGTAGAIGGAVGGAGAGIGASAGSMIGSFMGPMGMVLGPIIGGLAGKAVEWIFGSPKVKSELDTAREELSAMIKKESDNRDKLNSILDIATSKNVAQDRIRQSSNKILATMEEAALKQKGGMLTLNEQEVEMLKSRSKQLTMFGKDTESTRKLIDSLGVGSQVTADDLKKIIEGSNNYETELVKLRDATKQQTDLELARLEVSSLGQQKEALEMTTKLHEMEIKAAKDKLKDLGGGTGALYMNAAGNASGSQMSRDDKLMTPQEKADYFKQAAHDAEMRSKDKKLNAGQSENVKAQADSFRKAGERAELEAKIIKSELQVTKDQKDLVQTQAEFFKAEVVAKLRGAIRSDAKFLEFQKSSAAQGLSSEDQMKAFVNSGESVFGNNADVKELMGQGINLSGVVSPRQAELESIPSPMSMFQAPPLAPINYASSPAQSSSTGGTSIIKTVVVLNGREIATAVGETSLGTR